MDAAPPENALVVGELDCVDVIDECGVGVINETTFGIEVTLDVVVVMLTVDGDTALDVVLVFMYDCDVIIDADDSYVTTGGMLVTITLELVSGAEEVTTLLDEAMGVEEVGGVTADGCGAVGA